MDPEAIRRTEAWRLMQEALPRIKVNERMGTMMLGALSSYLVKDPVKGMIYALYENQKFFGSHPDRGVQHAKNQLAFYSVPITIRMRDWYSMDYDSVFPSEPAASPPPLLGAAPVP